MSDAAKLGRKRPITEEETIRAERKWAVNSEINSGILQERHIFYYSNLERNDMNQKRDEYVALYDARASGNIYVSLEQVDIETVERFWMALGYSLMRDA
ncbi:uncharacterized protein OCT59_026498 [Rhizophagus irregularis]|uniref:uncharacterized protein n=1 Tax=Rhizophagus irregularis TaxID=588596 RepID=UPI00331AF9A8|nr:hypothetical protein OCT59_026498 [Rhizophagus irregularis]